MKECALIVKLSLLIKLTCTYSIVSWEGKLGIG